MIKKISSKDKKDWETFLSSKEKIKNKDNDISKFDKIIVKIKKIDLHGYTLDEANIRVENLLYKFYKEGISKVIIITGKGNRSNKENDPYVSKNLSLLRYSVPEFLKWNEKMKKIILNFSKADIKNGGEGAFFIFLKKFKE